MANKDFDKNLRELLEDSKMDYDPSSWDALQNRIEAEMGAMDSGTEPSDLKDPTSFDQLLKDKLQNTQQEYDPASWGELSEKIDKDEALRGRILRIGILQCLAILLIFLSLWNWKGAEIIQNKRNAEADKTEVLFAFIQMQERFYAQFVNDLESRVTFSDLIKPIVPLEKVLNRTKVQSSVQGEYIKSTTRSTREVLSSLQTITSIVSQRAKDVLLLKSSDKTLTVLEKENSALIASVNKKTTYGSLIERPSFPELTAENVNLENEQTVLLDFIPEPEKKVEKSIAAVFSPDLYLIRSADDPIYPLPSYFTDSYGLTGGALFNLKSNNIELETGFLYSSVSYIPRHISERYSSEGQYFETSLNKIFFNLVALPVQFKWHFDLGAKSSFYAMAGSTFNMVINSNFDIINNPIAAPLSGLANTHRNDPLLASKDFEPGVFEGGEIFDNAFFTADIGIGFQQRVANRFSLFVQPTLSTQFSSGIGPNQDKLHRASIILGAKYHLN